MHNDETLTFLSALTEALESRIEGLHAPYYKVDGTIIGPGSQDFTKDYRVFSFNLHGTNAQLIDIPGIEGNEARFKSIIELALKKCHLVCYVTQETKGVEETTLRKIKAYLGKSVEVMGVLNIRELPKKEYDGEDYCGEMKSRIARSALNASHVETGLLKVIPPELYLRTIAVAALPGLCALAWRDNDSTFSEYQDYADNGPVCSSLEKQEKWQNSFLLRASRETLFEASRMKELRDAIEESCRNTPARIRYNALLRLLEAIEDAYLKPMPETVRAFKKLQDNVDIECDRLIERLEDDCFRMQRNMEHAAKNAVYDFLRKEMLENIIHKHIERNVGIDADELNRELQSKEEQLSEGLKKKIVDAIKSVQSDFSNRIAQSTKDWAKDMARSIAALSINVPSFNPDSFDFAEATNMVLSIGGYIWSGSTIGSAFFPVIGTAIGAIVGAIIGGVVVIVGKLLSRNKRITYYKNIARKGFESHCGKVWDAIKGNVTLVSSELSEQIDKLITQVSSKKEAAHKTYEMISHFAKDMRSLADDLKELLSQGEGQATASSP